MQSNEGFPDGKDLLTRKVNEYEGQHRFGGGTDTDCDPHVIDILVRDKKARQTGRIANFRRGWPSSSTCPTPGSPPSDTGRS